MSEGNWIILLSVVLVMSATYLIPRYLELKEKIKQQNLKLGNLVKEINNQGELSDELILTLLEKLSDADLEEIFVYYTEQTDDFKKVTLGKGMDKYYAFCIKIKKYIAGETMRRAEYKRNNNN